MALEITTTATEILDSVSSRGVFIKNTGPATVYLGGDDTVTADVTSTGGWPLNPGEVFSLPNRGTETFSIWGITPAGSGFVIAFTS